MREIFARHLDGASPRQIAQELAERGEVTAGGNAWQPHSVRGILKSRHLTGIQIFRGQEFRDGGWPVIIDRGTWTEAQDRRAYRASAQDSRASRFYLLRGLVMCKKCGTHMAGNRCKAPSYMYARHNSIGPAYCTRRIHAMPLEAFVSDAAVALLPPST